MNGLQSSADPRRTADRHSFVLLNFWLAPSLCAALVVLAHSGMLHETARLAALILAYATVLVAAHRGGVVCGLFAATPICLFVLQVALAPSKGVTFIDSILQPFLIAGLCAASALFVGLIGERRILCAQNKLTPGLGHGLAGELALKSAQHGLESFAHGQTAARLHNTQSHSYRLIDGHKDLAWIVELDSKALSYTHPQLAANRPDAPPTADMTFTELHRLVIAEDRERVQQAYMRLETNDTRPDEFDLSYRIALADGTRQRIVDQIFPASVHRGPLIIGIAQVDADN